jgi:hypothetical protein
MSKQLTPFGKGLPYEAAPAKPAAKKGKFPNFAKGGSIAEDGPTHKAAPGSNPPSGNALDDGKPSGGGTARGGGAAKRGKKFQGTF